MRFERRILLAVAAVCLLAPGAASAEPGDAHAAPLVIGHRGASGYRPEHTLASYRLAAEQGADFIEPDLVSTRDGMLVARHENEIGATTDVASHPEFAERKTTKVIDGVSLTGWFTEDFTLDELKTLRAKERIPQLRPQNTQYDGRFEIPTLQQVLDLRKQLSRELGRPIGVYPETKHPTYFRSIGLPLEEPLVRTLTSNGLNRPNAPVFVQSFETGNLRALDSELRVPLVQLLDARTRTPVGDTRTYGELATPAGLRSIAEYADGVGPSKDYIVPRNADQSSAAPTGFVEDAHAAGLAVHPYTFRRENNFLPLELRSSAVLAEIGDLEAEIRQFVELGVDGFFTDNPDIGVAAVQPVLAVIGDTPYGGAQLAAFQDDVAAIDADRDVGLVMHLGDIKSGSTQCTDAYFAQIRAAFDGFDDPLVYTPGDNEWTDCHRANNGGYLPTERLAALRDVFFDAPGTTLGDRARAVEAQAGHPENVLFAEAGVQFGTLHIVGSNDGRAPWFGDRKDAGGQPLPETEQERALREAEVADRQAANLDWIDRIFVDAIRSHAAAVAIGIQADMWDPSATDRSGFDAYEQRLAERSLAFGKPVLLLNGDSHVYTSDKPLTGVPNLSRVTVNGSTSCPHEYLRLRIDTSSADMFSHERVPLPSSAELCPA
jgi:glycerophosphoryl diester phosphodiesterase